MKFLNMYISFLRNLNNSWWMVILIFGLLVLSSVYCIISGNKGKTGNTYKERFIKALITVLNIQMLFEAEIFLLANNYERVVLYMAVFGLVMYMYVSTGKPKYYKEF